MGILEPETPQIVIERQTTVSIVCHSIAVPIMTTFRIILPLATPTQMQVLVLRHLSLTLGETYLVRWEVPQEEYQRFNCHPEEHADEAKCKARGCIWEVRRKCPIATHVFILKFKICFLLDQQSNIERVPWCFYPKDYGYHVRLNEHTMSGIWFQITRNKRYQSRSRSESPDIDDLHVQVTYHSGNMLQFKVCLFVHVPCHLSCTVFYHPGAYINTAYLNPLVYYTVCIYS